MHEDWREVIEAMDEQEKTRSINVQLLFERDVVRALSILHSPSESCRPVT